MNFLVGLVGDRHAAADLVQESYLRVLTVQREGRSFTDPRALLYRTARNLVIDRHRRAIHRDHADVDALQEFEQPHASPATQPEQVLASKQVVQTLVAAIENLPPRCREALLLHTVEGLGPGLIAERMGITRSAAEKQVARGLLACRHAQQSMDWTSPH